MLFQEFVILLPLTTNALASGLSRNSTTTASSSIEETEDPDPDGLVPPLAVVYDQYEGDSERNCTTRLDASTETRITWCNDAADTVDSSAVLGNFTVDQLEEELGELGERHNVSKRLTNLEDAVVFEGPALYNEEEFFEEEN